MDHPIIVERSEIYDCTQSTTTEIQFHCLTPMFAHTCLKVYETYHEEKTCK
jgi:hypothetical protein